MRGALIGLLAWFVWWRWMGGDFAPRALLLAVGLMVLGVALAALADTPARKYALLGAGILFLGLAVAWPLIATRAPGLGQSARTIGADFRVWLALFLLLWCYAAISQLTLMIQRDRYAEVVTDDIRPFRQALERYVFPRRLDPDQIKFISDELKKINRFPVVFRVNNFDSESSSYRGDLQRAFEGAGWATSIDYADNLSEGLHIQYKQTLESSRNPSGHETSSPTAIQRIFQKAGVQVDGSGGGSDASVVQNTVVIAVGRRRRDAYGTAQKWILP